MKKILSLLLLSSSLFSMQLALKMQTPRFDRVKSAVVKQQKAIVSQTSQVISKVVDTPKVYIDASSIRAPHSLSDIKLYHGKKGFVVLHDDKKYAIEKRFMDETARNIAKEGLKSFLKTGYFALNQTNDGAFTLKAHHRLTGGGPMLGAAMYWITKSLCYGTALTAAGALTVTTAGAGAAAVTSLATLGTSTAIAGGIATSGAIVTTAGVGVATAGTSVAIAGTGAAAVAAVSTAVGATGATVAGVGVVQAATMTTAVGIAAASTSTAAASVGTGAAVVIGIETLSTAVGTFFGMLPTP